ncbi:hypothetical protein AB0O67_19025 [Streptomyces sp. NPDC086077]
MLTVSALSAGLSASRTAGEHDRARCQTGSTVAARLAEASVMTG